MNLSNEALPQPISKRKDKEYKKKKSKTFLAVNSEAEITLRSTGTPPDNTSYNLVTSTKPILEKQTGWLRSNYTGKSARYHNFHFKNYFYHREIYLRIKINNY